MNDTTTVLTWGQWGLVYFSAIAAFLIIDGIWLAAVMKPLFADMLGDQLREKINIAPAAGFYLFYVVGILFFAVAPNLSGGTLLSTALTAAFLGVLAYGTFDMTNLSVLKSYTPGVAFLDTGWGGVISAITAVIARQVALML